MFILLPAPDKFGFVEESLDGKKLLDIIGGLHQEEGTVALPYIDMEMKISMKDALMALGMKTPFSPDADFTGISETGELFIGDVVHQTFLKVDEEGTEAAGATAVVFVGTSYPPPEPFHMVVDRPFIFAIVDMPTKTVLFLGRSLDPEVSS
jgi:serpin B